MTTNDGPNLDLGSMLRQAQKMSEELASRQAELASRRYEGSAGGGMVKTTIIGGKVAAIAIDPSVTDDVEMLADLITVAIPHEATLGKLLFERRVPNDAWPRIGATLARFHARGVQHADLNAHNILLDDAREVYVLDFDRGCIRARGGWEAAVLSRLQRSIAKITGAAFPEEGWRLLLSAYSQGAEQRS